MLKRKIASTEELVLQQRQMERRAWDAWLAEQAHRREMVNAKRRAVRQTAATMGWVVAGGLASLAGCVMAQRLPLQAAMIGLLAALWAGWAAWMKP